MSNRSEHEFEDLLGGYFDQTLDEQQLERFAELLREDERHVQRFVELSQLNQMIETEITFQAQAQQTGSTLECEPAEAAEVFAELLRMEQSAKSQAIVLDDRKPEQAEAIDGPGALSVHDFAAAGSYLLRHSLRTKAAAMIGIAAVLALSLVLLGPWGGGENLEPLADNDDAQLPAIAAQLTAQQDAQWAGQSYAAGETLRTGQRLDLVAGQAEITTRDGAVAVIQAPCALELLGTNTIRLHTGKMVGIVEVDSAKGFTVRTPHMDVTDLGTRFGIDADSRATEVHVFEGEVKTLRPDAPEGVEPIALVAGQSVRTSADSQAITTVDQAVDRFAALMPEAVRPETVAGWQIIAINGEALESPGAMRIARPAKVSHWITADQSYPQQVNDETTFTVQTRFDLPAGTDHDSAAMLLRFDANDRVTQVRLNGRPYTPPTNYKDDGHDGMHTMRIDGPLLAAENTLQLDVVDVRRAGATKWEVRVDWSFEPAQDQSEP